MKVSIKNINALKDFPKEFKENPKKQRREERMSFLLKTCTFDRNSYLVYAVVLEEKQKSITGYAYLKITARKFLQLMSEKHRPNPKLYQFGNHKTAQIRARISVHFPTIPKDQFEPKIDGNMKKIFTKIIKNKTDVYFAPIDKLQMIDIAEEKMTKVSFYYYGCSTYQKINLRTNLSV